MTDQELFALAVLVESGSRMMWSADQERYNNCRAPAYGDTYAIGQAELEAELKRRGLFGRPDRDEKAEAELANQVARAQGAEQARDALQVELSTAGEREKSYRVALESARDLLATKAHWAKCFVNQVPPICECGTDKTEKLINAALALKDNPNEI